MPTILITGTSSGIGAEAVRVFAAAGWNVAATSRRAETRFPDWPGVAVLRLVLEEPEACRQAVAQAVERFGGLDLLVNNAGHCLMGPLEATGLERVRRQFEVNLFGLIGLTQAALPHLRRAGGGIINVASVAAENGYPFGSAYSASKAAVMALTEGLNVELAPVGVFAKAVLPGLTATDIFTKLDLPTAMPAEYLPHWRRFLALQGGQKGFDPALVARVILEAATDGRADKVRYYPTPDARLIPLARRMLGQAGYWRSFRRALLEGPSPLQRWMAPRGTHAVKLRIPEIPGG